MKDELLDELEHLLVAMKDNLDTGAKVKRNAIDLLKRMRIFELYREEQTQYDQCVNLLAYDV